MLNRRKDIALSSRRSMQLKNSLTPPFYPLYQQLLSPEGVSMSIGSVRTFFQELTGLATPKDSKRKYLNSDLSVTPDLRRIVLVFCEFRGRLISRQHRLGPSGLPDWDRAMILERTYRIWQLLNQPLPSR